MLPPQHPLWDTIYLSGGLGPYTTLDSYFHLVLAPIAFLNILWSQILPSL